MKFDLDTAWKDTTRLLRGSLGLLAVIAGVFYFLPYFAAVLWIPGLAELSSGQIDTSSAAMEARMNELLSGYWWALLLLFILQSVGLLAMLALLRRRARPTVAEALKIGARSVWTYLAASILAGFAISLLIILLISVPVAIGLSALAVIGGILAFVGGIYLFTKLSIVSPVIAIDGELSPIRSLRRAWRLTKGNSLRIFFFYFLLFIAYLVISTIISMLISLIFALGGAEAQLFGEAFNGAFMNTLAALLFACVLASVHAQLTRLYERHRDESNRTTS